MSKPRFPRNNRKRVDDYYGVHDTGMATQAPPQRPAAPSPAQVPPGPQQAPQRQVPPAGPVQGPPPGAAPQGLPPQGPPPQAPPAPPRVEPRPPAPEPRSKPDPLNDPLTSETFLGVQPESDTFEAAVTGAFRYGGAPQPPQSEPAAETPTFDAGYDQFAPPRFEPRAESAWSESAGAQAPSPDPTVTDEPTPAPADHPDGYIDVEVVDVVEVDHEPPPVRETLAIDAFPYTQIDESYVDPAVLPEPKEPGDMTDFNESLKEAMSIEGALGVALVDSQSGMALATAGDPTEFNLEVAAAGNSALVQAMSRTLGDLDLDDHIEDILITLGSQYQIVRPIKQGAEGLFLYLVLDRSRANLAMARFRLTKLEEQIEV
ncbi:hypothetical protein [Tsukamurella strandjordii]|uniref:hypothetical protein n=1 Tax=Tsukamurella strandjordii TaxID=147577 RepID=UPI0031DC10F8